MTLFKKKVITVIRQLGGVGDVLMMSCVYRGLRDTYPKHQINLVTGSVYLSGSLMDVATHNPFIDKIFPIEPYDMTTQRTSDVWQKYYKDTPRIENELFWERSEQVIDLNTACVDYEWPALHDGGIKKPRYQIWCEAAGVVPSTYKPIYVVTKEEARWAQDWFEAKNWDAQRCVAIATSCCDPRRALGHRKLHAICMGVRELGYRPVVVDPTFHYDDVDFINGMRVKQLMPLLQRMRLAISADSGLLHMAGTMDVPVIGLFGPTDAKMRMEPYRGSAIDSTKLMPCAPCWYNYPCLNDRDPSKHFECLNKLSVDMIVEECDRWLTRPSLQNLRVY